MGQCRTTVEYTKGAVGIQLGPLGYLVRLKPYMPYVCQYLYNVLSRVPATGTIATRDRMLAVACDWLD